MRNLEFFTTGDVAYSCEEAIAFTGAEGLPIDSAVIGITYPFAGYRIERAADVGLYDFEYILDGAGELFLNGRWVRAQAGDTVIWRGEEHRYRALADRPWKKVWINFTCAYMSAFLTAYGVQSGAYAADTRAFFDTLLSLSHSGRPYGEICFDIAGCLHGIAAHAARAVRRDDSDGFLIREALTAAVYRKVTLDDLAAELHMSKSNLIRVFRRDYGMPPYEFLLRAKVDAAKLLLKNTRMSVKEIADRVCVSDEHYFSALFLRRTGMRPGAYRTAGR